MNDAPSDAALSEALSAARAALAKAGVDGRTSFLAELVEPDDALARLALAFGQDREAVRYMLSELAAARFVPYETRRANGFVHAWQPSSFALSQGYRRGLRWRGLPLGKTCWDVCIYQQLLQEVRPRTIIELGTALGASALFFVDHAHIYGLDTKVISLDLNGAEISPAARAEPNLELLVGDVALISNILPAERLQKLPHPWVISEDCHVQTARILRHLAPHLRSGDYLVVEDLPMSARGSATLSAALAELPGGTLMVDTHYTDLFGRNMTCAPDAIFRRMETR